MALTVVQVLPAMEVGGVEKGTLEIASGLVAAGHRSIVISKGGQLVAQLLEQGSEHITWPIGEKSIFTFNFVQKLRQLLVHNTVDILHARSRLPAWIAYFAWKKIAAAKRTHFVTTVHGHYSVNAYSKIMTKGEKVIAVSEFIKNYIVNNYNVSEEKITVIHRGIAPDKFYFDYEPDHLWLDSWRKEHLYLENKFVILLPGRITRRKGAADFIKIIHALKNIGLPVIGLIAGKPDPNKHQFLTTLKTQVSEMNLSKHIKFIGNRNDLREVISVADMVLSLAKKPEAFGRTALESLSLGTPVIAYNRGGEAEILSALFPAGLVPPDDIEAVVSKACLFYQKTVEIKQNVNFTLQSMIDKTINLYESVAGC